jgi:hypothetical protein
LAKKLDLVNIGAAGTFVARGTVTVADIKRAIPVPLDVVIRPAGEVLRLVDAGPPKTAGTQVYVSVLVAKPKLSPRLPLDVPERAWTYRIVERRGPFVLWLRRVDARPGLDMSAVEKAFGARATTRGWPTFERIAKAVRSLEAPATRAPR